MKNSEEMKNNLPESTIYAVPNNELGVCVCEISQDLLPFHNDIMSKINNRETPGLIWNVLAKFGFASTDPDFRENDINNTKSQNTRDSQSLAQKDIDQNIISQAKELAPSKDITNKEAQLSNNSRYMSSAKSNSNEIARR